jgi:hypothetical protein
VQHVAATDRPAVHHGDHRLRDGADDAVQPVHVEADAARAAVPSLRALALVAAGGERPIAGAGEHHDPDVAVLPGGAEGRDQLVDGPGAEGVQHLRPVDGDPGHAVARVVEDVLEGRHGVLSRAGPPLVKPVAGGHRGRQ